MNLPNRLTIGRLILTMIFVAVMSLPIPHKYTISLIIFIVASATDFLDGYIARARNIVTTFGKLMDPLADKILTGAVFILLLAEGLIAAWMVVVIMAREFLVTGLRLVATNRGFVLAADWFGKWKTIFQIATGIYFLWQLAVAEPAFAWAAGLFEWKPWIYLGYFLIWGTVILTLYSGLSYLWKNRELLLDEGSSDD